MAQASSAPVNSGGNATPSTKDAKSTTGSSTPPNTPSAVATTGAPRRRRYHADESRAVGSASSAQGLAACESVPNEKRRNPRAPTKTSSTPR
jgi:hypothetical protein